jgi:UDP:flavonoid glycosyltransferase YjiC (YdhE family)
MAFDQFDNANRIEKLGCGRWLRNDRELANELQQILDKPVNNPGKHQVAEHPGQVAGQEQSQADAAGHAVGFLEEMLSERGDAGVAT